MFSPGLYKDFIMKIPKIMMIGLMTVTFSHMLYADEAGVAKVIIMKGLVKAKLLNGQIIDVKVDQSIPEGATLQTADKSFVKLIFIDKSQMNLGPNSQMIINAFPKKEAGIITLVKGEIRSHVTKDYMEMDDKSKSKLYIKTKTAAMGIRGTYFHVMYNPENQNTALVTYEGKVALSSIEKTLTKENFDQRKLESIVSNETSVMVEKGQISAVNLNIAERAMTPTLLGIKQFEALKDNETGMKESTEGDKKQYRNALPPGADSAIFSNVSAEKIVDKEKSPKSDPNGFFNASTGEYKLPAGSIIDLNSVNIIPPPANAVFDPNSKTYTVPENFGKIDKSTGEYKAPEGLKLGADGKFIVVDAAAFTKSQVINKEERKPDEKSDGQKNDEKKSDEKIEKPLGDPSASTTAGPEKRAPASVGPDGAPPMNAPGAMPANMSQGIYGMNPAMATFVNQFAPTQPQFPIGSTGISPTLQALATDTQTATQTVNQNSTNTGTSMPNAKVKFIFNAQ
jgi:hypothetical protein